MIGRVSNADGTRLNDLSGLVIGRAVAALGKLCAGVSGPAILAIA
jgi:hypothetical protein